MKTTKQFLLSVAVVLCLVPAACTQPESGAAAPAEAGAGARINDSNTALHALASDYKVPYGVSSDSAILAVLDRIYTYLDANSPAVITARNSEEEITDYSKIDDNTVLKAGAFRLTSYEWGVTYAGMLNLGDVTGIAKYTDYTVKRYKLLNALANYSRQSGKVNNGVRTFISQGALDDCGSICAAMIKTARLDPANEQALRPQIEVFIDYIMNKELRLADGTFSRNRPQTNSLWLDDMFMGIPAVAQMGKLTGDRKYFDEAVKQIRQFTERMFVPEKGLYMHGWIESSPVHPVFHWGRANGWAILTMAEVLDVLPEDHPGYPFVLEQFRKHIKGIVSYQSSEGFWHQLLDRSDSYLETSCTAIFTYCIARGINKGWLDHIAFGPAAQLGWNAITTKVNEQGQVEGTCVGTGMAFDPAFYYYRLVSPMAAHGYGPVLLAGSEMLRLNRNFTPKLNDSAVQYYRPDERTGRSGGIFSVTK
ncbi:MAG: glycoside hydrolase family 88 protein [Bacteroidales bacterium]|nr:glycoside hydrolase family 88 protein [Bacteroidales bacterium]MCR5714231.1 glycoside hydrolase family 88 protein [Bacteroidales bacterium]